MALVQQYYKITLPCIYRSLVKEHPLTKRVPTPNFWPNFLYRVKVCSNERPLLSKLLMDDGVHALSLRSTSSNTVFEVRKFVLYFTDGYYYNIQPYCLLKRQIIDLLGIRMRRVCLVQKNIWKYASRYLL